MKLKAIEGRYAVARLGPDEDIPAWASGQLISITKTHDELSIVCDEASVPADVRAERGYRCLGVMGPIPFDAIGVAASLCEPLARASISVLLISTFDTDYLLIKEPSFASACAALASAGHEIS